MELKWLDDYIALIEAGTFSAAAERRHVSQPAFSRRIQMLEDWLGVALVDRTRKPIRFTPAAQAHEAAIRSLVARIYEFRAELKSEAIDSTGITIAAQHTLAAAYLPGLMDRLRRLHPDQGLRIRSENRADSVAMLMRGQAEVLITYETAQAPCGIPAPIAQRHLLGQDALVLVACPALHKSLRLRREGESVPMLCFPPDSFFGQVLRVEAMPALMRRHPVLVRCVSEFAMGLRELARVAGGLGHPGRPAAGPQDPGARGADGHRHVCGDRRVAARGGAACAGAVAARRRRAAATGATLRRCRQAGQDPGSPRSQNSPAMICSASRATGRSRCSSGACWQQPG